MALPTITGPYTAGALFPFMEGATMEFKQNNTAKMADTLCGFLNGSGGHYVIGVRDDGIMSGIGRTDVDRYLRDVDTILGRGDIADTVGKTVVTGKQISCARVKLNGATEKYLLVVTATPVEDPTIVWQVPDAIVYRLNASNRRVSISSTTPAVEIRALKAKLVSAEANIMGLVLEAKAREAGFEKERAATAEALVVANATLAEATKSHDITSGMYLMAKKKVETLTADCAKSKAETVTALELLHTAILESKRTAEKLLERENRGFFAALFCC